MKKLLLSGALIAALAACKKNDAPANDVAQEENTDVSVNPALPASTADFPQYAPDEVAQLLKTKDNDTVYVTNFFATWCAPCLIEIPHFKKKMTEMAGQKVKFTFVSVDQPDDWNTAVKSFGDKEGLNDNIVLFDMAKAEPNFAHANTEKWDGGSIPFTRITKGNKVDETIGSMTEEALTEKLNQFK